MEKVANVYNIYFDKELNTVIMEWNGYATREKFKEGTELMLNLLVKHKAAKVLADIKNMTLIGSEEQQWLENSFIPRAIEFGFKAVAMIKPDNYFNKVAVESVSYKVNKEKLNISFFDNVTDAKDWLSKIG
jgi:hypothetical protein